METQEKWVSLWENIFWPFCCSCIAVYIALWVAFEIASLVP